MKKPYSPGRLRVRFGVTSIKTLIMSASGTQRTYCRLRSVMSEERTFFGKDLYIPIALNITFWRSALMEIK